MKKKDNKPKKQKVIYIDDGRTIADMSNLTSGSNWTKRGTSSSFKEIWKTYWGAVRMMFKPMLVVVGFIGVIYLLLMLIFWIM